MATIYQRFKDTADKFSGRPAVYWKEGKTWLNLDYSKFLEKVDLLAGGLANLGANPGSRLAILSENRPEWLMSDLAINKIGAVSVPIHASGNEGFIKHVLIDSGSKILIVSLKLFEKHKNLLLQLVELKKIVVIGGGAETDGRLIPFEKLMFDNRQVVEVENELASIVYTSGTTGLAKGVMLTNKNFLSNVDAGCRRIEVTPEDKFLSFLPISHVLERTAGSYVPILHGASIGYVSDIKELSISLKEFKPTILIAVPKIFEKTQEKIMAKIQAQKPPIKKFFFKSLKLSSGSWQRKIADLIFYKKIRNELGGRLRFAVSGGAALHERILRFFKNVGIVITEGYGLTETSPVVCANSLSQIKIGTVGQPLDGVSVKISADKEVLVKGDGVFAGYWNPSFSYVVETRQCLVSTDAVNSPEIFDEDGWFKTGDLGFLDRDNFLTIIGRKKDMIVTSNGKNINPEKIEALLNLSPYINQALLVGHKKNYLAALVVPEREVIEKDFVGESFDLNKIIRDEIEKVNRELMEHEYIKKHALLEKPFTIEAEELTPTLKPRRHKIEAKHKDLIEGLYG